MKKEAELLKDVLDRFMNDGRLHDYCVVSDRDDCLDIAVKWEEEKEFVYYPILFVDSTQVLDSTVTV